MGEYIRLSPCEGILKQRMEAQMISVVTLVAVYIYRYIYISIFLSNIGICLLNQYNLIKEKIKHKDMKYLCDFLRYVKSYKYGMSYFNAIK